ncbi:MAG: acetyl-CoA carboxylase biotin carboxylase subunit [Candidatus Delongbacteria bacterium]|nr:acetyl-CoA carboxylase biotin carboxylase subunit [Candidatus Delongbacteria bacterium]
MKKILVANRGEIAVRVIQACRGLSIKAVAVYSEVDRTALHVKMADEAICIGPPAPHESYLNQEKLIAVALERGCDAVHPGYGFLAENPEFAQRCEQSGLIFIGPRSETIKAMGNKVEARELMLQAGIPLIPGMKEPINDIKQIAAEAEKLGLPVLVKAAAGGGGKGMRVVRELTRLEEEANAAMREARSAFGDGTVFLEKWLDEPRHIEFQVLADGTGHTVHLFERECSIQRRHQKVVEETPSTALDPELRRQMGETAVAVAKTAGYLNAGTVEFLLDKDRNYYFLEMNTRIQVEHPITEFVTGIDLVAWQIRIAAGEEFPYRQEELLQKGHAIECRIYAEDPAQNFLPSPGKIHFMKEPTGPGIRNDTGIYTGFTVTTDYDPILSKLVTYGEDREAARARMVEALQEYTILGIHTTVDFLHDVLIHPQFIAGNTFTNFIETYMGDWQPPVIEEYREEAIAAAALWYLTGSGSGRQPDNKAGSIPSPWEITGNWEIGQGQLGA